MFGLFDNLDDPKKAALMALSAGLLNSRGNFGQDLSQGLMGAMQAYGGAKQAGMRSQDDEQRRQLMQMQIEQAKRQNAQQQQRDSLMQQFTRPGIAPLTPNDDEGNAMPSVPPSFDHQGYARALPGMEGLQAQSQLAQLQAKDNPFGKVDPKDYTPESVAQFVQSRNPADLRPRDKIIGEDLGGKRTYRTEYSPTPLGEVPKTPPPEALLSDERVRAEGALNRGLTARGQNITMRGQDLTDARAREQAALAKDAKAPTEIQAKGLLYLGMMQDAEGAIGKIKEFDPSTVKNQTLIALARGDIPKLPAVVQNSMAGKEAQQYTQAAYQWSEAMLRQLTGAAAPDQEVWRNARTYFPMPGDSKAVVDQKNTARKAMTDYIRQIAGKHAEGVDAARAARPQELPDPLGIRK